MSRIIKTAQLLRRNWKKSTFLFGVLAYGTSYVVERYRTFEMMRAYCEEAKKYGEKPIPQTMKPKHVTVILNPEANSKKSNVQFEKFAAPLLHLAGFRVSVFQTEKGKQALDLMQIMSNTDAVIVAGGDGTVQEAVTGLLRRPGLEEENLPLGIVPLGKTNTVAQHLFGSKSSSRAQLMAEAVMAVIRETTVNMDVLKIQFADEDKPVYGMVDFEQGIFGDIEPLVEKYWYFGFLKDKFAYFRNSSKEWSPIVNEHLEYVAPCSGCSKCYIPPKKKEVPQQPTRWWHVFVPRKTENNAPSAAPKIDESIATRINEDCGKRISLPPGYSNISVSTTAADPQKTMKSGSLCIKIFPEDLSKFMSAGLSHRKSKVQDSSGIATVVEARQLFIETVREMQDSVPEKSASIPQSVTAEVAEKASLEQSEQASLVQSESESLPLSDASEKVLQVQNESSSSSPSGSLMAASLYEDKQDSSLLSRSDDSPETTSEVQNDHVSSTSSEPRDLVEVTEASQTLNQTQSLLPTKEEIRTEDKQENMMFSYIDKEKYQRASCVISLLPKQVTVYA